MHETHKNEQRKQKTFSFISILGILMTIILNNEPQHSNDEPYT